MIFLPSGIGLVAPSGPAPVAGLFAEILADMPVWYGRLNEVSGTTAIDYGSSATNGTYAAALLQQPAIYTNGPPSVLLNGNNIASVAIPASVLLSSTALTIEAIIRPTNISGIQQIVTRDNGSGGTRVWQFRRAGSQIEFIKIVGGVQSFTATNVFTINTSVHIVVTITDQGAARMYRNGVQIATATFTANANYGTANTPIYINRLVPGGTDYGFANYSEVAIYNTALSPARVLAHAAAAGF